MANPDMILRPWDAPIEEVKFGERTSFIQKLSFCDGTNHFQAFPISMYLDSRAQALKPGAVYAVRSHNFHVDRKSGVLTINPRSTFEMIEGADVSQKATVKAV